MYCRARILRHKHEEQRAEFCIVYSSPHWATSPDCSLPSFQADHKLSFVSHLTGRGVISDSQGPPLDTEHDAEEEKVAQVNRQKAGSPLKVTPHRMCKGLGGGIFFSHFSCVYACVRARVHTCVLLHMCGHMCGYMCQSLRSTIMLNCFPTIFIGAGSPNQTHNASIQLVPLASFLQESRLCLFEIRLTGGPPYLHAIYVAF